MHLCVICFGYWFESDMANHDGRQWKTTEVNSVPNFFDNIQLHPWIVSKAFSTNFPRGAAFLFTIPVSTRSLFAQKLDRLRPWDHHNLKIYGIELIIDILAMSEEDMDRGSQRCFQNQQSQSWKPFPSVKRENHHPSVPSPKVIKRLETWLSVAFGALILVPCFLTKWDEIKVRQKNVFPLLAITVEVRLRGRQSWPPIVLLPRFQHHQEQLRVLIQPRNVAVESQVVQQGICTNQKGDRYPIRTVLVLHTAARRLWI